MERKERKEGKGGILKMQHAGIMKSVRSLRGFSLSLWLISSPDFPFFLTRGHVGD